MPADCTTSYLIKRVLKMGDRIPASTFTEDQWQRLLSVQWPAVRHIVRVDSEAVDDRRAHALRRHAEGAKGIVIANELGVSSSYVSRLLSGQR